MHGDWQKNSVVVECGCFNRNMRLWAQGDNDHPCIIGILVQMEIPLWGQHLLCWFQHFNI